MLKRLLPLACLWAAPAVAAPQTMDLYGNLSVRTWLGNNAIHDSLSGGVTRTGKNALSYGVVEVASNYWFGLVRQEQLDEAGALFGIGFSLARGGFSLANDESSASAVDSHWLSFDVLKLKALHGPMGYLAFTANYLDYFNGALNRDIFPRAFSGLGGGVEGMMPVFDSADLYLKSTWLAPTSQGAWATFNELGARLFISPQVALTVAYKFHYLAATNKISATVKGEDGKESQVEGQYSLQDWFHAPLFGTTVYF